VAKIKEALKRVSNNQKGVEPTKTTKPKTE
jgi:hypothetical protein